MIQHLILPGLLIRFWKIRTEIKQPVSREVSKQLFLLDNTLLNILTSTKKQMVLNAINVIFCITHVNMFSLQI